MLPVPSCDPVPTAILCYLCVQPSPEAVTARHTVIQKCSNWELMLPPGKSAMDLRASAETQSIERSCLCASVQRRPWELSQVL